MSGEARTNLYAWSVRDRWGDPCLRWEDVIKKDVEALNGGPD